ncbi:ribonuclease H-like domain-containing protein [Tanacetum coccineum]
MPSKKFTYTQALKKVEAQLVTHQKNQLWYEEKIRFMKIDLDDKTDVLTYHKKLLAEAVKEKEELKTKLENFQSSSKGLSKLLNSQMSKRDKSRLGYGDQVHDGVLSYENEVFQSVFDSRSSDVEDSPVHDRFANVEGMHAVPPPMTGNYMPSGPDREIDDSMFTYGPKQSKTSESDTQTSNFDSCESNSSVETLESVPEPVVVETPKLLFNPKVLDNPQRALKNKGIVDSRCSRHMTGNKAYLAKYQDYNGGPVAFGGSKGYITGKGKIKTGKLDFEDVCFVKELQHFNLFSVSQMCDKKNKVLFTDTECLVLSSDFKLPDENQVLLRIPRQNNMYSFNIENIVPSRGIKREYSNARTPQQNGVAERKNRTLIEAARTMLADSFLPNTFWAEAVSTACYVLNRVLVTKPQNKTPYELITGKGPNWLFDLDYLTDSMNYQPVRSENQANKTAGPEEANHSAETKNEGKNPNMDTGLKTNEEPVNQEDQAFLEELERLKRQEKEANDAAEALRKKFVQDNEDLLLQAGAARATSTNTVNTASTLVSTDSPSNAFSTVADFTNLESTMNVSPIPTSKIHSIHPTTQILGDPKSVEELLQFKIQKVWILVDFPYGKKEIRTKWVYKNKKDERGVVVRNKASLTDGIEEFLLVGKKMRSVCVSISQVLDPMFLKKVYKVVKALSMIGSLMYLTASRPDIMYLKGKPKLGLWYPRVSSFDLEAYSDSDYARANLDRKSTTGGCQFLGRRLISW